MIFIDTGAFLAKHVSSDQYHHKALQIWEALTHKQVQCFTSNFVLDEFFTLLARRTNYQFAAERAKLLFSSTELRVLRSNQEDEQEAIRFFEKFADQNVSFTDCISFALMRRNKLKRAFSFDRHFTHAGFELWP